MKPENNKVEHGKNKDTTKPQAIHPGKGETIKLEPTSRVKHVTITPLNTTYCITTTNRTLKVKIR